MLGDFGYDCNYCHGKNHFAKEYMLRKMHEKKENVKDEAYYTQKIEGLRNSKSTGKELIVEEDDDDGRVQVWSTDSEDEEVRNPIHGKGFIVKE